MVAAGHPGTAAAAAEVLRSGGNAFDAVLAAGFAAAVAEPGLTSLGGGGFLLARTSHGDAMVFDFFVDTPGRGLDGSLRPHFHPVTVDFGGSLQDFHVGRGSVAVPGCLPGYLHVHDRLGRLSLADVVAPAVALARHGVVVTEWQAFVFDLLEPILTAHRDGADLYAPHGRLLRAGDIFVNQPVAQFLEDVGAGRSPGLHSGPLASAIAADMAGGDGLVTRADLAAYEVVEREPLEVSYKGMRILTNPPPSFGGSLVAESLRILGAGGGTAPPQGSPEDLCRRVDVMIEVDRRRAAGTIGTDGAPQVSRGTTHVSVADADGNVAAMTTSNGEGSGYIVPGTGVMLNNMLGEDDLHPGGFHSAAPGTRVASMMSPTICDSAARTVALGSGGSKRIRTALMQVITAIVDHGAALAEAVESPRLHWDGETVQVEPGYTSGAVGAVSRRWPVNMWSELNLYFGGVHVVDVSGHGAGDPRRGGTVLTVRG